MMKKTFLVIGIAALGFAHSVFAANPVITNVSTAIGSGAFNANYRFDGNFSQDVKFFGWMGEFSKPLAQWDRDNLLTTLGKNQATPIFFQYSIPLANLQPGTIYGYVLADTQVVGTNAVPYYYAPPGTTAFRCFTTTNANVACPGSQPGSSGAGGATPAPATFNYIGTPSVVCDSSLALCDFKVIIQATSSGLLSFKLHGFPKTTYDAGNYQYAPLVNQAESPTVVSGQQYQIAFSGSFAQIQAFTTTANDSKFYFTFYEEKNPKTSALSNVFDMATHGITFIPNSNVGVSPSTGGGAGSGTGVQPLVLAGSASIGLPSITIMPPTLNDTGTLTITGTIQAPGTPINVDIGLFMGTDPNNLPSVGSLFSGTLNTAKSFSKSFVGQAAGTYYFEIRDLMSGYSYGVQSFTVTDGQGSANGSASFNYGNGNAPAGTAVNGACGTAAGTTAPTTSSLTGTLCAAGNASTVLDSGSNWSWTCGGLAGGTPAPCTANKGTDATGPTSWLKNPLAAGLDTFPKIFKAVYNGIILPIAIPFLAIMIMYSGFLFVTARKSGSVDGVANAKRVFKYTMIGGVLLLGGLVIANALQGTLCEIINNCPAVPSV